MGTITFHPPVFVCCTAEAPTFISKPQAIVKVAEGQEVTIACEVYGAPKPAIQWSHNEVDIEEGDRFSVNMQGKIVGNLTIKVTTYNCFTSRDTYFKNYFPALHFCNENSYS